MTAQQIKALLEDYEFHDDIMDTDPPQVRKIKKAISLLPEPEKIIFLLQTDVQSQRKVGALLGVSHSTVGKEVNKIKEKIKAIMETLDDDDI